MTPYAIAQRQRELIKERMAQATTEDAADALNDLTYDLTRAAAFNDLIQSGDACAVGHALLRLMEMQWESESGLDAKIQLREEDEIEMARRMS